MLEPQTRAALTEELAPPPGFELSYAVGTTFTLDLATALTVPLSFASRRVSAADDTIGVLDAIRRASDRIDIFAQAGALSMGQRSDLVTYLERLVHPVQANRGLFHPKVWFLEYAAGHRRSYRMLCASRNLTDDRSWDVLVRLDGHPAGDGEKRSAAAMNKPLVTLLRTLPEMCVQPMDPARRSRVEDLAEQIRTTVWEKPDHVRSVAFHVLGIRGAQLPDVRGQRALLISPFVSDDGLALLRRKIRAETHLLSRAEALDALAPTSLDDRLTTYVLDDAATRTGDDDVAEYVPGTERLVGLHAKAIILDRGDGAHVFLGSANATTAAWQHNVELMIELIGNGNRLGVQPTLDALGDLKERYDTEGGAKPDADEEAERRLERVVQQLAGIRMSVRVVPSEPLSLRVWADGDDTTQRALNRVDEDVTLRWHLLTRPDLGDRGVPLGEGATSHIPAIPLTDVTPFLVLTARDGEGRERRTIVIARLLDDIDERRDAIVAKQLTDRAAFVRLLTLLLELSGAWSAATLGDGAHGFFGVTPDDADGAGLFEALVRAVGDRHHGLADARRIIDFLRTHDEHAVIPAGFEELWEQVWAAHLELTGGPS